MTLPRIDPKIISRWVSWFRTLDAKKLRALPADELVIILHNEEPLAVLLPYAMYLELQEAIQSGHQSIERLTADIPLSVMDFLHESPAPFLRSLLPVSPLPEHLPVDSKHLDVPACHHCGMPSLDDLCPACFMVGHRSPRHSCTLCTSEVAG